MVSSNNTGAWLLRDEGGRRGVQGGIKRCIRTGQGRGLLIVRRHGGELDLVGRGSKLGTTKFLHETPGGSVETTM